MALQNLPCYRKHSNFMSLPTRSRPLAYNARQIGAIYNIFFSIAIIFLKLFIYNTFYWVSACVFCISFFLLLEMRIVFVLYLCQNLIYTIMLFNTQNYQFTIGVHHDKNRCFCAFCLQFIT